MELVHPVYLDTPMLVSFVAALEGGVSYEDESTRRTLTGTDKEREGKVRAGLPLLASILPMDMSGRLAHKGREEESEEVRAVRRHTEASLFNLLLQRLSQEGQLVEIAEAADLQGLAPGTLIRASGDVIGNPLQQMLDLFEQLLPYLGYSEEELRKPKKVKAQERHAAKAKAARSGNPQVRAAAAATDEPEEEEFSFEDLGRMLFTMRDDLANAAVRDVLLEARSGVRAVLTLSTEFFTDQTIDYMLEGQFSVIGKVTRVLSEDETINLTRRTALGLAGPDVAREVVQDFSSSSEIFVRIGDPIVDPPALQVLPLAVFV